MISGTAILGTLTLGTLAAFLSIAPLAGESAEQGRAGSGAQDQETPEPGAQKTDGKTARAPDRRSAEEYFEVCDYDGDGLVTFDEAHSSLGIDREAFRVYDVDRDGLISLAEFKARYNSILDNGGAFPPPVAKAKGHKPARRTPEELLAEYDTNENGALEERELKSALEDYQVHDLEPDVALEKLDRDGSKQLEIDELEDLANILSPSVATKRAKHAKSIEELFGKKIPRVMHVDSTPLPPRIAGPISPYRRLDLDGNGSISTKDLSDLQRPLQLSVRINAVIATLDLDGDGVVSEQEFWSSMSH